MTRLHLHHVHLFTGDIDRTVDWWVTHLGATVAFDGIMANSRNVFLRVGDGRLHLYDQRPRGQDRNALHHVGIRVEDLARLVAGMEAAGLEFPNPIREFGGWSYIMCMAPDNVLLELFQVDEEALTGPLKDYFADGSRFSGE
jgi:catechol 2,3-dioxygenase-like lactoylglutathione lyase family enzyme